MDEDLKKTLASGTEALRNVTEIFNKLAGPLADELGKMLGDRARVYRLRNMIKIMERTKKMLAAAGVSPEPIPPRLFLPAVQSASAVDNETLQELWAALLANAANPRLRESVLPSFIEVLKQLTPEEAVFMTRLHRLAITPQPAIVRDPNVQKDWLLPEDCGVKLGGFRRLFNIATGDEPAGRLAAMGDEEVRTGVRLMIDDLVRLGLLDRTSYPRKETSFDAELRKKGLGAATRVEVDYSISHFGLAFMTACTLPK